MMRCLKDIKKELEKQGVEVKVSGCCCDDCKEEK